MRPLLFLVLAACASAPPDPGPAGDDTGVTRPPPPPDDEVITESFQYFPPKLDLTFLVDEDDGHAVLAPALDAFIADLEARDIDYHLGVTSVYRAPDGAAGHLANLGPVRWAEPSQPGAADFLRSAMNGIATAGDPCGTWAARAVIQHAAEGGPNDGFYREGSEIAFVVVSDEPDRSNGFGFPHDAFVTFLREQRERPEDVSFHAVTRPHDQPGPQLYLGIVEYFGGCIQSLDEPSMAPTLACVLDTIEPHNVFPLRARPDPETLQVVVLEPGLGAVELTPDQFAWDPDRGAVDLRAYYPRFSAVVEIRYRSAD